MSEPRATFDLAAIVALLAEYEALANRVQSSGSCKLRLVIYPTGNVQVRRQWKQEGEIGEDMLIALDDDDIENMLRIGIDATRRLLGEADHE